MTMKEYQDLLLSFKKRNKVSRQKFAESKGFKTPEEYIKHLQQQLPLQTQAVKKETKAKKKSAKASNPLPAQGKIHYVDILDCSSSMMGERLLAAKQGIELNLSKLKEVSSLPTSGSFTLWPFSTTLIKKTMFKESTFEEAYQRYVNHIKRDISYVAMTALSDAIIECSDYIVKNVWKEGDSVVFTIHTDGGDNTSSKYVSHLRAREVAAKVIKDYSKDYNFVYTFTGTKEDTDTAITLYGIDKSNTAIHDNTADGMSKTFEQTAEARINTVSMYAAGEDITKGFYKNIKK